MTPARNSSEAEYRPSYCCLESTEAVIVAQYSTGYSNDVYLFGKGAPEIGDPFMSLVPPINQLMNNYTVRSVQGNRRASPFPFRYINIAITRKFFKDTHIRINDSVAIPIDGYTPIYCSNNEVCGYGAQVEIPTPGTTTIYHEEPHAGLYASYYIYQQHNSNAFPLGFELEPLGGTRIVYVSEFNSICVLLQQLQ